jgi:hypothetical protein
MLDVLTFDVGLTLVSFDAGFDEMQVNSFQAIFIRNFSCDQHIAGMGWIFIYVVEWLQGI